MPVVSVIVPIYNAQKYLGKCVESILLQTYQNMEILLIDDGSTDGCFDICEKYASEDERIRVIHKPNGGLVSARKAGAKEATGDYVICVDADDWIEPNYIEALMNVQRRTRVEMVAADLYFDIGDFSKVVRNSFPYGVYGGEELCHGLLYNGFFFEYGINPHMVTKLISRKIYQQMQMAVDERIMAGEDAAVTYPCVLAVDRICIADICGYHYVQRPGSMTKTGSSGEEQRAWILFHFLEQSFENAGCREVFRIQLNQYQKYFMLLRMVETLDRSEANDVLKPYGGLEKGSRVVLYGAGGLGQSIFRYLDTDGRVKVISWIDRCYDTYRVNGMKVDEPQRLTELEGSYDYVIVANISGKVAEGIRKSLLQMGAAPEKIRWLSEEFLCEDIKIEDFIMAHD